MTNYTTINQLTTPAFAGRQAMTSQPTFSLRFIFTIIIIISGFSLVSQPLYLPLNQDYNRSLQKQLYSNTIHFHTSIRPYFISDIDSAGINYDSIQQLLRIEKKFTKKWKQKTWDKLLNDDVATFIRKDYAIIANPLINFSIGTELSPSGGGAAGGGGNPSGGGAAGGGGDPPSWGIGGWTNTRGLELKGWIGKNVGFYTNFYENQALFPEYLDTYIRKNNIIPGQGMIHTRLDNGGFDYSSASGYLTYQASKYFNFQFGHGKNFYGDGYRSLLLSDNSFNNLFFKATVDFWHIKYQILYNQYIDIRERQSYEVGYDRKYTTTHYLSWAVSKRVNISFFDAIIWSASDSAGNYRGFDLQYLNPIIFMRPVEFSIGSPDNAMMGLNLSVIVGKHNVFYGQLILDEFKVSEVTAGNGWWGNKQGFQLGFKGYDMLGVDNLYFQTEYNWIRPYTYSQREPIKNYGHYNQPLAHPFGANFWESVNFIKYSYKRLFFNYQFIYSIYGGDPPGMNYGKDIYLSYNTRVQDYDNYVGQGIKTTLIYNNISASYLINPAYNLNFTIGYINRNLSTDADTHATNYIYIGLRTSIGNKYYDF